MAIESCGGTPEEISEEMPKGTPKGILRGVSVEIKRVSQQ